VHFFAEPMRIWQAGGHEVLVTSRRKEIATDLLDAMSIRHEVISSLNHGGMAGMASELLFRDWRLLQVVRRERPDIMVGIGGVFIAHVGFLTRTPSIVFYDTENASLSNLITYPFCSLVAVPDCYQAWLPPWHLRYPGYHELSYLHPQRFTPDKNIAIACGLAATGPTFLIRTVSWQASHDLTEQGWTPQLLRQTVDYLSRRGKVLISAEGELPEDLRPYAYTAPPEQIHHLMGHLALLVGESATMASECAVMGVPAIYAAHTGRGYTDEQEQRYRLVRNLTDLNWPNLQDAINALLDISANDLHQRRAQLLDDKIDVAAFVADLTLNDPESRKTYRKKFPQKPVGR
jgi:predicted glycosyltransferase